MRSSWSPPVAKNRAKALPRLGLASGAFRRFCMQIAGNAMLRAREKTGQWIGRLGQEVNRQPRALLSVLLIGVVAFLGLAMVDAARSRTRTAAPRSSSPKWRPAAARWSRRSAASRAPSTASSTATFPTDLFSILTGSKLVRVNRATQEVEPGLAENVDHVARQPDLYADASRRRHLVGRRAVHVGRRAVHASRRSTTRRSSSPLASVAARSTASRWP